MEARKVLIVSKTIQKAVNKYNQYDVMTSYVKHSIASH